MKYKVYNKADEYEMRIVSVILGQDSDQPDGIKMMHCMRCGEKLGQYHGAIYMVIPGYVPVLKYPFFRRCPVCKENYAIGSISL